MHFSDFSAPIKYGADLVGAALPENQVPIGDVNGKAESVTMPVPFVATSAAVGTVTLNTDGTVVILAGSAVGSHRTAYVTGFAIRSVAAMSMTGGTILIEDTQGVPIWGIATANIDAISTVCSSGTPGIELLRTSMGASGDTFGIVVGSVGSITTDGTIYVTVYGVLQ